MTTRMEKQNKTKLKIGYLSYCRPHLGGSGVMTLELAKQMKKRGHDIFMISYPNTFLLKEELDMGLKIFSVDDINYPCFKAEPYAETFASLISTLAIEYDLDIIHVNYAITHGLAALLAKEILAKKGKKLSVVITNHGSDIHTNGHHSLLGPSIEYILSSADGVTYVSKSLKNEADSLFPSQKEKGEIINNFVDTDRFKEDKQSKSKMRKILNIPEDTFVVYHASNYRELKNPFHFLELAKLNKGKKLLFLMLGEGPLVEEMEKQIYADGLSDMFMFVGRKENVIPYINVSDLAMLPSKRESFGLILAEALACGIPVMGSNKGGIPEQVEDGVNGFLFDEVNDCNVKLNHLMSDKKLMLKLAKNCRPLVENKFGMKKIVSQYESFYSKCIAENK